MLDMIESAIAHIPFGEDGAVRIRLATTALLGAVMAYEFLMTVDSMI